MYLGLFLISKYIFEIYSESIPIDINWTPPINNIAVIIEAYPGTSFPYINVCKIITIVEIMAIIDMQNPINVEAFKGAVVNDVIPSIA